MARRRNRLVLGVVAAAALLLGGGYLAAGAVIYDRLSRLTGDCDVKWAGNTPASFRPEAWVTENFGPFDTTPYFVSDYEAVSFPSRQPGITISAWHVPARPGAPVVVAVHGRDACKRDQSVLIPAGMLHDAGFAVLVIDLRDHGDSTREDGRFAGGTEEYLDVLGAWDWLVAERRAPPERIGLLGVSMGAASAVIAAGKEARVAAVWEDSGYADPGSATADYLAFRGYPTFVAPAGPIVARLVSGDDLTGPTPLEAATVLDGRPLYIVHGTADETIRVAQAEMLAAAIRASGGTVEPWILDGVEHAWAMLEQPAEYERRLIGFFGDALGKPAGQAG